MGSRGWGEERQYSGTFHSGLANGLAWQKLLENKNVGVCSKDGEGRKGG